ncbi:hypothetical protein [Rothia mucilaginosa]|jgi:glutathione S-transferase
MTGELSQDSSKPQDTSQDSGVSSEGQLSNPTGENAVVQSNQKYPTVTNQNSQSNKKYDLGVLFVHGIGNQKSGDTFSAIYPSIRDEFNSDSSLKYREVSRPSNGLTEAVGEIYYENIVKNVIFRELNWNKKYSSPVNMVSKRKSLVLVKEWIVDKVGRTHIGASLIGGIRLVLNVVNCFLLLLYFLGMKIISSRVYSFIFSLSSFFLLLFLGDKLISIFSNFQKITPEDRFTLYFSVVLLLTPIFLFFIIWSRWDKWLEYKKWILTFIAIFGILVFIVHDVEIVWKVIVWAWKIITWVLSVILGIFVSLIVLFPFLEWWRIKPLWEQINDSADYIRTGSEFGYLQAVEVGIKNLMKESDKVIVVAHSMGEYLTYNSLKRNIANIDCEKVQLIGVGGGLGLVSLMGSLRASGGGGKYSIEKSTFLSLGAALQVFILLGGFTISVLCLICDLHRSLPLLAGNETLHHYFESDIPNPYIPFETSNRVFNIISHSVFFVIFLAIGFFIEKIISIDIIGDNRLKFFKYSHFLDPVGNLAGFYYGKVADKAITPNSSFAHSIRSYFTAGELGVKSTARHMSKHIYMRRRIVQHIVSTVYENPDILQKKTRSLKDIIVEGISCVIIAVVVTAIFGNMNLKLIFAFLPLLAVFNYLILKIFVWIRVVAETTRDMSRGPGGSGDTFWDVLFWFLACLLIYFMTDIVVLIAIDNILSINIK